MLSLRSSIILCLAALACSPKLTGTRASNADCKAGESCSPDGLCLRGTSNVDAGIVLTGTAAQIAAPPSGAYVPRIVAVSAAAVSDAVAISDVTFLLNASGTDAGLGQAVVTVAAGQTYAGTLSITNPSFNGAAVLRAVAHRSGAADIGAPPVPVNVDQISPSLSTTWTGGGWQVRGASIAVTAAVADTGGSGVASAQLQVEGGNTYLGTIASGTATFQVPGAELADAGSVAVRAFSLVATDAVGNATILPADAGLTFSVDDVPPVIAPVSDGTWHNQPTTVVATITDQGSGIANASLLLPSSAPIPGLHGVGGGWSFSIAVPQALAGTEGPVSYQIVSDDLAGNRADAGSVLNVDTVPPSITAAQVNTTPDFVDGSGTQWFAGPAVAPSAGPISVSATITDRFLDTTTTNQPAAIVGGTRYTGNASGNVWSFSIPRSVGQNASGPLTVSFDAQDLAGNHPVAAPTLTLQFDDANAAAFAPAVAADTAWYPRGTAVKPAVNVSLPLVPRSGLSSVVLKVSGQTDIPCSPSGASAYSCALPSTYAPAGTDSILAVSVAATSNLKVVSTGSGTRRIDDAPPVVSNANAIPYPGGSGWGHDGSHFTLRDSGTIFTFTAYDCGAGLSSGASSIATFGVAPQLATRNAVLVDSGGRQTCSNGSSAVIYNVNVTGDFSTSTPGSFTGPDNTLSVSVTLQDGLGHAAGAVTKTVNATRRLWQTAAMSAGSLAMGPVLVVSSSTGSITGLNAATGATLWGPVNSTSGLFSGPAVGGSAAAPVVYYGLRTPSRTPSIFSVAANSGAAIASCDATAAVFGACPGIAYSRDLQLLSLASDGSAAVVEDDDHTGIAASGADCGYEGYIGTHVGSTCSNWFPTVIATTALNVVGNSVTGGALGRGGQAFIADRGMAKEIPLTGGSFTAGPASSCLGSMIVTDKIGNDAVVCDGQRSSFSGGFAIDWTVNPTFTQALQNGGYLVVATSGAAQPLVLSSGSNAGGALASQVAWAIDGSSPPVVYLANGAALSAQRFSGGAFGSAAWGLPAVPGTSISDVVMDRGGVLYVSSNGQVSAIATDSPGLGTANNGWPIRGHDACRSFNLEYACPY